MEAAGLDGSDLGDEHNYIGYRGLYIAAVDHMMSQLVL